ncbi:MAG TPA: DUF1080 domain-containing protein [Thermoguttaceae bacterium]|nr:DUF1080 domain-containing protein [Thermoguttaceae bacterium]
MCLTCLVAALLLGANVLYAAEAEPASATGPSQKEIDEGFVPLFDGKTLQGWVGVAGSTDSYYAEDGLLICKADGHDHVFTEKEFANFILRLDIKLEENGNNGVGIRTKISRQPHIEGMELQVLDDTGPRYNDLNHPKYLKLKPYQHHGSIYGVVPAKTGHMKKAGQWNQEEVICDGRHVKVILNGAVIIDADLDKVEPMDGKEHPGLKYEKGRIGLHAHGNGEKVFFRNIRIKELP